MLINSTQKMPSIQRRISIEFRDPAHQLSANILGSYLFTIQKSTNTWPSAFMFYLQPPAHCKMGLKTILLGQASVAYHLHVIFPVYFSTTIFVIQS